MDIKETMHTNTTQHHNTDIKQTMSENMVNVFSMAAQRVLGKIGLRRELTLIKDC